MIRRFLREIAVTLDALLGGDHRQYGHTPPGPSRPPTLPPPRPTDAPEAEPA